MTRTPRQTRRPRLALGAGAVLIGHALPAAAAGGHHAVDDAAVLDPGHCEAETWFDRERHAARTLSHAGAACRVGAFDIGLAMDRLRPDGAGAIALVGGQLKWAHSLAEGWNAGVVLAVGARDRSPRFLGSTVVVPVTWKIDDAVAAHFNVGRDFVNGGRDTVRAGAALEWAPADGWSLVTERFRDGDGHFWRVGARWSVTPSTSLDLSRTRRWTASGRAHGRSG